MSQTPMITSIDSDTSESEDKTHDDDTQEVAIKID